MLSNVQLRRRAKNNTQLKRCTSTRINTNFSNFRFRKLNMSNSEKLIEIDQRLSNTMHMSLYLVSGSASFGNDNSSSAASNNPQPTNHGMTASASASGSSSSTTTVSPQEGYHESQLLGDPAARGASFEEQLKMSKPTHTTISHGVISVVGRQRSMEDAVAVAPALLHIMTKPDPTPTSDKQQGQGDKMMMDYDFFAVYDGHGEHGVAHRCKERLHHIVAEVVDVKGVGPWKSVMTNSFTKMSEEIASKEEELYGVSAHELSAGSMALVVLVSKDEIVVANCGNSRVVLFRDGVPLPLCSDHQSERPEKKDRLEYGSGNFGKSHSTSASIGTCSLRDQIISAPEVTVHERTLSDDFLVIASDGLWDVVSNDMACDIVRQRCSGEVVNKMMKADGRINNGASACAAMLVELALAHGSKDNISVIVVELQHFDGAVGSSTSSSTHI